jgi:hypothetical protein
MIYGRRTAALLVAAATLAIIGPSVAQNASAPPTQGATSLRAGFAPDPVRVAIRAGGPIDASRLGSNCVGMIANAPDHVLRYSAGSFPLFFRTQTSGADTTLAIRAPDGRWYCDDDTGGGLNAEVRFAAPMSGAYAIYVGTYGNTGIADSTLDISELAAGGGGGGGGQMPDPTLDATYGSINLRRGFRPDPRRVQLTAGGPLDAARLGNNCNGNIARAPDYQVSYTAGRGRPLIFRAVSSGDPTLVINDANGNWVCNDDSNGSLNAEVVFNQPASGVYDVWVGSLGQQTHQAELQIAQRR